MVINLLQKECKNMFLRLDAELARLGLSEDQAAQKLGLTPAEFISRKNSGAFQIQEAQKLSEICGKSIEYLFLPKDDTKKS
jgi:hypothetical protein